MKKMGTRNLLLAMMAILAMGGFIFGCTDEKTENATATTADTNPPLALKGSIQGLVVDVSNVPVAHATATLAFPGGTTNVTTDSAGQFLFENVPVSGQLAVNQDYYEYDYGSGNPYLITVQAVDYETSFTAAMLDYATLESTGQITSIGGDLQAVKDLQVDAITTVMRRPIATASGYVVNYESAQPIADALVTLSRSGVPDPWDIWYNGYSEWSFTNNSAVTDVAGLWTLATVPEAQDASPVSYTITIGAAGFGTLSACSTCSVNVGSVHQTGTIIYWADYNTGDQNYATAYPLRPTQPQQDTINPYVTATNLPVAKIALPNLSGPFTFTFNEAMRTELAEVIISVQSGAPIIVALSWDTTTDPNHPVLTVTPETSLPEGFTVNFELLNFFDANGKPYLGTDPQGNPDAFKSVGTAITATKIALLTAGDPTLMQASGVAQDPAVANPLQPIGGKSGNVPQANNLNLLDWDSAIGLGTLGDATNEANTVFLSWDAAVPLEGEGVARYYKVYSEFATGGFASGVPVFVAQTPQRLDGNPDTSIAVTLSQVETAIANYNATNPASDPDLPLVSAENGTATALFFDDGFTLNMAVTTVNSDSREGPYSNVATIVDVVPPTVADQGFGFDATVPTNWAIKPINVTVLALANLGVDYNAADYAAFAALSRDEAILMSEDLAAVQTVGGTLVNLGGGGETLGACSVTNPEAIPGSLPEVTCVVNGIAQVQQNDHIILSVTDEAGNVSEATDSVAHLYDGIPPFVATGTVIDNDTDPDQIVLTMSEAVNEVSAETIANYTGIAAVATATPTLGVDGFTVTLTAAADGGFGNVRTGFGDGTGPTVDIAANNVLSIKGATPGTTGVADLVGNVQPLLDLNSDTVDDVPFGFQLVDEIAPRISSAFTFAGAIQAINAAAFVDSDGILDVGDATDAYALFAVFTEPVVWDVDGSGALDAADADALGLALTPTPVARFTAPTNFAPLGATIPGWTFAVATGPVAALDAFTVTAADLSGIPVNLSFDTINLGAPLGGVTIN